MGQTKPGIRFSEYEDTTIIAMRKKGHKFKFIGIAISRRGSSCRARYERITGNFKSQKWTVQKQVRAALMLNRKEQLELDVIDSRDPIWVYAMHGQKFEDFDIPKPQAFEPKSFTINSSR